MLHKWIKWTEIVYVGEAIEKIIQAVVVLFLIEKKSVKHSDKVILDNTGKNIST